MANQPASQLDWHHTSVGQRVVDEEKPFLAEQVRRFHGDTLVWAGQDTALAQSVSRCMVRNCFYAAARGSCAHPELASFQCDVGALSLPTHSVDGFVLHHTLELEADPRHALREVIRRLPNLRLAGEPERVVPFFLWGRKTLPVAWDT